MTRWEDLGTAARLFRVAHGVWGAFSLAGLAYLWRAASLRRRDRTALASFGLLSAEGVALLIGRGDCPFGPLQARLGDPVPMFEWVLPPRAAKAAIPALTVLSVAIMAGWLIRAGLPLPRRGQV